MSSPIFLPFMGMVWNVSMVSCSSLVTVMIMCVPGMAIIAKTRHERKTRQGIYQNLRTMPFQRHSIGVSKVFMIRISTK